MADTQPTGSASDLQGCKQCGSEFEPAAGVPKGFCSGRCYQRHWRGAPDRNAAISCRTCGNAFHAKPGPGRMPRYCSSRCRERGGYTPVKPSESGAPCPGCGVPFTQKEGAGRIARYCSPACRARATRTPVLTNCVGCRAPLVRAACRVRYGNPMCTACRGIAGRDAERARLAHLVRTCAVCGEPFTPLKDKQTRCSKRCLDRQCTRQKKARHARAFVEDVLYPVLFERDGGLCGVCGMAVDPSLGFPHPYSGTIDHVVPLTKGGAHSYANTQLAHFGCNSHKGNRTQ